MHMVASYPRNCQPDNSATSTFADRLAQGIPMEWYTDWFGTPYYALLYGHRDADDARAWVDAILGRWRLPAGARLLDMACGRGRHAGQFHAAGMQVQGIDISAESIAEARKACPGVSFSVHDMRRPFAKDAFDAVTCLFTSLGYFEHMDDDRAALATAFQALRPGGRFVLDLMNPDRVKRTLVPHEVVERGAVHFEVWREVEQQVVVKRIEVRDGDATFHFQERVRMLEADEVAAMAREVGFVVEEVTDGPLFTPFDRDHSSRAVWWMHRP